MSDLTQTFRWTIPDFHRRNTSVTSISFAYNEDRYRLLVYPMGNPYRQINNCLSVYLQRISEPSSDLVHFMLSIINQADANSSYGRTTTHAFTQEEKDWGWNQFKPIKDIESSGFLDNDSIVIQVTLSNNPVLFLRDKNYVQLKSAPRGCLIDVSENIQAKAYVVS